MKFEKRGKPTWCPGCGNFGIQSSVIQALNELNLTPSNVVICSGIGCSSNIVHWINANGFHTIHGRGLAVATGVHLANTDLTVIAHGGDGDSMAIGSAHFIHAARRNLNITLIVHNNQIYGLTKGQTSPTSELGFVTKTTPFGNIEEPINVLKLALAADATFVARSFAGDIKHLTKMIKLGIKHKGFSVIDVLQPCVTFNKINTFQYFNKRIYEINPSKTRNGAFNKCQEWGNKIPIGIFYQEKKKTYTEQLITKKPLIKQKLNVNISKILDSLK